MQLELSIKATIDSEKSCPVVFEVTTGYSGALGPRVYRIRGKRGAWTLVYEVIPRETGNPRNTAPLEQLIGLSTRTVDECFRRLMQHRATEALSINTEPPSKAKPQFGDAPSKKTRKTAKKGAK